MAKYLEGHRLQELAFDSAKAPTPAWTERTDACLPPHVVFPQMLGIVQRYIAEKIDVVPPADRREPFVAPYYTYTLEILHENIRPSVDAGEEPEVPILERFRPTGSTGDVSFWTSREVREVEKSHVNCIVADTKQWEQSAAYQIDRHPAVRAFVKNAGLGFAIPYVHNGEPHDFIPDFLIRLESDKEHYLVLEPRTMTAGRGEECRRRTLGLFPRLTVAGKRTPCASRTHAALRIRVTCPSIGRSSRTACDTPTTNSFGEAEAFAAGRQLQWERISAAINETRRLATTWDAVRPRERRVLFDRWVLDVMIAVEGCPDTGVRTGRPRS